MKKKEEVRATWNGKNAVTRYKIDKFGGTEYFRVGTNAEDIPLKFQLKNSSIYRGAKRTLCDRAVPSYNK